MAIEDGDQVDVEYVGRLDDGTVFDTSREEIAEEAGLVDKQSNREYAPLTVEVGSGQIIEGIEEALIGMEDGDETTITVPPEKGYGEPNDERIEEYDAAEFEQMLQGKEPEVGMRIQTQQGATGHVVAVTEQMVRVDFNHELAGESLEFEVEIVDVNE